MRLFDFLASCDANTNLLIYETDNDIYHEGKPSCMFSSWTYKDFGTLIIESVSTTVKNDLPYLRIDVYNTADYYI